MGEFALSRILIELHANVLSDLEGKVGRVGFHYEHVRAASLPPHHRLQKQPPYPRASCLEIASLTGVHSLQHSTYHVQAWP
eukprot:1162149-Pelagomonas_calceolata.AAC.2